MRKYADILCCPFCRSGLKEVESGYICKTHGLFKKDAAGRIIFVEEETLDKNVSSHNSGINWLKSFFKKSPKLYYLLWHIFCPVMMTVNGPRMIFKYRDKHGVLVDIGSGPGRVSEEFINVDIFPFSGVDIVADGKELPFCSNSADIIVSEAVLEHVPNPQKISQEIMRILKPGGYAYVSVPFIQPYHASPYDYNRWTISGLKCLFPDLEIVKSGVRSGPWSALLMFLAYWFGVIFSFGSQKMAPFLAHVFMLVLGPFKYLDYFFMKMPGAEAVATQLYILGRKK